MKPSREERVQLRLRSNDECCGVRRLADLASAPVTRHAFASLGVVVFVALGACGGVPADAHDVAQIGGDEIALDDPDELARALRLGASQLLGCAPIDLTVEDHAYGRLRYWTAHGCYREETLAIAHRCPPGTTFGCAARIVSISDGDPAVALDPEMRMQSADAIAMPSLVTRGSLDLTCPPTSVRLDFLQGQVGLTILSGCRARAGYVFANGVFTRVPDEMLPPLAPAPPQIGPQGG